MAFGFKGLAHQDCCAVRTQQAPLVVDVGLFQLIGAERDMAVGAEDADHDETPGMLLAVFLYSCWQRAILYVLGIGHNLKQ
jgi:hypothetical protein